MPKECNLYPSMKSTLILVKRGKRMILYSLYVIYLTNGEVNIEGANIHGKCNNWLKIVGTACIGNFAL